MGVLTADEVSNSLEALIGQRPRDVWKKGDNFWVAEYNSEDPIRRILGLNGKVLRGTGALKVSRPEQKLTVAEIFDWVERKFDTRDKQDANAKSGWNAPRKNRQARANSPSGSEDSAGRPAQKYDKKGKGQQAKVAIAAGEAIPPVAPAPPQPPAPAPMAPTPAPQANASPAPPFVGNQNQNGKGNNQQGQRWDNNQQNQQNWQNNNGKGKGANPQNNQMGKGFQVMQNGGGKGNGKGYQNVNQAGKGGRGGAAKGGAPSQQQ